MNHNKKNETATIRIRRVDRDRGSVRTVMIQSVLMPNGELITLGKNLGKIDQFEDRVYDYEHDRSS